MPGTRRLRLPALIFTLLLLVVLYVTTAKHATYSSPFYTRTMDAISQRQAAEAKADVLAAEERRNERVARIQDEHDIAMGKTDNAKPADPPRQKALGDMKDKIGEKVAEVKEQVGKILTPVVGEDGMKSVAGRKTMKDGKVVVDESGKGTDGVAKVGNVAAKDNKDAGAASSKKDTEEERRADAEINSILKKGPIIIFSKSVCPYSKKAKNILQNLYTIVPPPFVVELDEHAMGPQLQAWLGKSTGRSTVPNVMINGKSVGGGDDIEKLHTEGKLIETIQSLGGKRIVEITKADSAAPGPQKRIRRRARL